MTDTVETWITLLIIVLAPLVPAMLLFKYLPSTAGVEGTWKGLPIKIGGAFAGYFIVVIIANQVMKEFGPDPDRLPKYETYTASADVTLLGSIAPGALDRRRLSVVLLPKPEDISDPIGANRFTLWVKLPGIVGADKVLRWPFDKIVVAYYGYFSKDIPLTSGVVDTNDQKIAFAPIELDAKPAPPPDAQTVVVGNGQ